MYIFTLFGCLFLKGRISRELKGYHTPLSLLSLHLPPFKHTIMMMSSIFKGRRWLPILSFYFSFISSDLVDLKGVKEKGFSRSLFGGVWEDRKVKEGNNVRMQQGLLKDYFALKKAQFETFVHSVSSLKDVLGLCSGLIKGIFGPPCFWSDRNGQHGWWRISYVSKSIPPEGYYFSFTMVA